MEPWRVRKNKRGTGRAGRQRRRILKGRKSRKGRGGAEERDSESRVCENCPL